MKLSDMLHRGDGPRPPAPPARDTGMRKAIGQIVTHWPLRPPDDPREAVAVLREMALRIEDWNWQGADLQFVEKVSCYAFCKPFADAAEFDGVRRFLLAELGAGAPEALRRALFDAYVATFDAADAGIVRLAAALRRVSLPARQARVTAAEPVFLDPGLAPEALARRMAEAEDVYAAILDLGISAPHQAGIMMAAHRRYVARTAPILSDPGAARRLLRWLRGAGPRPLLDGAEAAIDALLAPWTRRDPPDALAERLVRDLVELYGDPRTSMGAPWHGVAPAARQAFERMLMGDTLRLLFDAVSRTVSDADHERMWEARREFYMKLHAQKRINAAWVAFDKAGAVEAHRMLAGQGRDMRRYGRQIAGGARATTSLLILRVGRLTVVDGSHNYKVHVFEESDRHKPSLDARAYNCEEIRTAHPAHWSSSHDASGAWKGKLDLRLRDQ